MFLEIGATVLGIIQGFLVMINKRSNWIFYIFQMIFLLAFSLINHLYGDVCNNIIYLIMGIIGFVIWDKNGKSINIKSCSIKEKLIYISLILVLTLIISRVLNNTDDPLPLLDAFTTVSSFVATYYMMRKYIDTWLIWFINDIFYSIEYLLLPNQAIYLFLLNVLWTVMAVLSFINWKKIMNGE